MNPDEPLTFADLEQMLKSEAEHKLFLGWCRRWLRNADDCEDVCQDAFMKAVTFFHTFDGIAPEALRAWVMAILRNTCLNHLRRRTFEALPEDLKADASAYAQLEGRSFLEQYWREVHQEKQQKQRKGSPWDELDEKILGYVQQRIQSGEPPPVMEADSADNPDTAAKKKKIPQGITQAEIADYFESIHNRETTMFRYRTRVRPLIQRVGRRILKIEEI